MADEDYYMFPVNPCQNKHDISIHQKIFEALVFSCLVYCKTYFISYLMLFILGVHVSLRRVYRNLNIKYLIKQNSQTLSKNSTLSVKESTPIFKNDPLLNPILGGVFYVRWLGGVVQNYPKSLNKGNKLISYKTFQNTSSL